MIIVFVASLFFATNAQTALFFLIPIVILIPLVIVTNKIACSKSFGEVQVLRSISEEGKTQILVQLKVKNTSYFPVFQVYVDALVKNLLTKTEQEIQWQTSILPKKEKVYEVRLESAYCGKIEGDIKAVYGQDFLGLSKCPLEFHSVGGAYIYPDEGLDESVIPDIRLQDEKNTQNRYLNRKGNDITEILHIREYQKGDSIKSIHWKLSKKIGKKMVRELDMPANQDTILFMAMNSEEAENPLTRHRVVSTGVAVSEELLCEQKTHDAVLFSEEGNTLGTYSIEGREAKDWWEHILLDGNVSFEQKNMEQYIQRHNVLSKYATVIVVTDEKMDIGSVYPGFIQIVAQ